MTCRLHTAGRRRWARAFDGAPCCRDVAEYCRHAGRPGSQAWPLGREAAQNGRDWSRMAAAEGAATKVAKPMVFSARLGFRLLVRRHATRPHAGRSLARSRVVIADVGLVAVSVAEATVGRHGASGGLLSWSLLRTDWRFRHRSAKPAGYRATPISLPCMSPFISLFTIGEAVGDAHRQVRPHSHQHRLSHGRHGRIGRAWAAAGFTMRANTGPRGLSRITIAFTLRGAAMMSMSIDGMGSRHDAADAGFFVIMT